MKRTYTEAQKTAIETRDGDLVVSAGAGSGKTGVLVERFIRLVTAGDETKTEVDKILVITFTEKATREMKTRITHALDAVGETKARRKIETAYISTIHGFCSRLLGENPFDAGVDPEFKVMDAQLSSRRLRVACENALQAAQLQQDREILQLLNAVQSATGGREPLPVLIKSLEDVFHKVRGAGWTKTELSSLLREDTTASGLRKYAPVRHALAPILDELAICRQTFREARKNVSTTWATLCEAVETAFAPIYTNESDPQTQLRGLYVLLERLKTLRYRVVGATTDELALIAGLEQIKAVCEPLRPMIAADIPQAIPESENKSDESTITLPIDFAPLFWKLLTWVWDFYDEDKRSRGALDNDDLQSEAVGLLEKSVGVREQYRQRFAHLMVDEFQDTNPIQMRLIELLHRPKFNVSGDKSLPNQLFIVGDVQQSIYAFRNADPSLFQGLERRFRENNEGTHVTLSENFRSHHEILAFVTQIFGNCGDIPRPGSRL